MEMMIFVTDGGFQQTRPVMEVMIFCHWRGIPTDLLDVKIKAKNVQNECIVILENEAKAFE